MWAFCVPGPEAKDAVCQWINHQDIPAMGAALCVPGLDGLNEARYMSQFGDAGPHRREVSGVDMGTMGYMRMLILYLRR